MTKKHPLTGIEKLVLQLMLFDSWTDQGVNAKADFIVDWLTLHGVAATIHLVRGRKAVVIEQGDATAGPVLVLHAHTDTVRPGNGRVVTSMVDDEFIHGNGAADNNVGVALAMRLAAAKLPGARRFLFSPWEETYPTLVPREVGELCFPAGWGDFAITLECSRLNVVTEARGALDLALRFEGESGHDAHTESESNAMLRLFRTWSALQELPFKRDRSPHYDDGPRVNPTRGWSEGGAANQTCKSFDLRVMIRTLPGQDHSDIVGAVRGLPEVAGVEVETDLAPVSVARDDPAVQALLEAARRVSARSRLVSADGGSDLGGFGCHGVEFGAWGEGMHSDDELVGRKSIRRAYAALVRFARWFAAQAA